LQHKPSKKGPFPLLGNYLQKRFICAMVVRLNTVGNGATKTESNNGLLDKVVLFVSFVVGRNFSSICFD